jgi:hypothetical protein
MNGATQVLADEVFGSYTTDQLIDWVRNDRHMAPMGGGTECGPHRLGEVALLAELERRGVEMVRIPCNPFRWFASDVVGA